MGFWASCSKQCLVLMFPGTECIRRYGVMLHTAFFQERNFWKFAKMLLSGSLVNLCHICTCGHFSWALSVLCVSLWLPWQVAMSSGYEFG